MYRFTLGEKVLFHGVPAVVVGFVGDFDSDYLLDIGFYAEDEELTKFDNQNSENMEYVKTITVK